LPHNGEEQGGPLLPRDGEEQGDIQLSPKYSTVANFLSGLNY